MDAPPREQTHYVIAGSTLRICVPYRRDSRLTQEQTSQPPEEFTGTFTVAARNEGDDTGAEMTLPAESIMSEGGRYIFTLGKDFTASLPAGEQPYEAAIESASERFTIQVGFLIVRDMTGMSQDERDLQCAKDLRSNRLASGGDIQAYSFPGGATIQKVSLKDLEDYIVRLESRVNQAGPQGWYQTW